MVILHDQHCETSISYMDMENDQYAINLYRFDSFAFAYAWINVRDLAGQGDQSETIQINNRRTDYRGCDNHFIQKLNKNNTGF